MDFDIHAIERRWRAAWDEYRIGQVDLDAPELTREDVFYNLVEFPYPSAEGLHVGHVFRYAGADALGRYMRMRGKRVFQPIGFDAFGIHTENYALAQSHHPMDLTGRTTERFRAQLSRIGCAWDWSHAVDTSRADYYRWTQWILVRLFNAGLMYQADAPVTWCPSCLTVLAREQLEGDACERCGSAVTERVMRQWFLRTTAYADRLLQGLDELDWPERAKRLQRAWIGRSEGREFDFGDITVFTTRPDTIMNVTFIAVPIGHARAGASVPHPVTGAPIPVVEAGYVIESYGTGAVMGVPAYDDRDARYAAEHGLPVVDVGLVETDIGRPSTRYRLRDWLISRQRYWGPPIPIIHCDDCGARAVPEADLPVVLPYVDEFRPTGSGVGPLASAPDFVNTTCPDCGGPARRETDVSDTFVDSSWYFLRYPSSDIAERPWDEARTAKVLPVDHYAGGPEHVQRHHLYARFVTMALHDLGLVPFDEPFPRVRLGGFVVYDGAKMSKSRGNVVTPDEYIAAHGADVLRAALLFSGPWEQDSNFRLDAIAGVERFFARAWRAVLSAVAAVGADDTDVGDASPLDDTIRHVEKAVEAMHHNVAIARLMEAVKLVRDRPTASVFVRLLAPFAPHVAEELWHRMGEEFSVHNGPWPAPAGTRQAIASVEIVVQVDGRVRDRFEVSSGRPDSELATAALERTRVTEALAGRSPARVVVVPDRLVNVVTTSA